MGRVVFTRARLRKRRESNAALEAAYVEVADGASDGESDNECADDGYN